MANVSLYYDLRRREFLDAIKGQPEKLAALYRLIADVSDYLIGGKRGTDIPLSQVPFVLAADGEFHPPGDMVALEIASADVPRFLAAGIPEGKELLHPQIAKDAEGVRQLVRCGLVQLNRETVARRLQQAVNSVTDPAGCPESWQYPHDVIEATLFLISNGGPSVHRLVAQSENLQSPRNMFIPGSPLDWSPLWSAHLLPGFHPIHEKYLYEPWHELYGVDVEKTHQYLQGLGIHGFRPYEDRPLMQSAAYAMAEKISREAGHNVAQVARRRELGYSLECQGHCTKVFGVKGVHQPEDLALEESEKRAAQQKRDDYILVCVYDLPNAPDKVGYKEIPDPELMLILRPGEKVSVPSERWLRA